MFSNKIESQISVTRGVLPLGVQQGEHPYQVTLALYKLEDCRRVQIKEKRTQRLRSVA